MIRLQRVTEPQIMSVRPKGIENILYNISDGNITSLHEAVFQSGVVPDAQWCCKQHNFWDSSDGERNFNLGS